MKNPSYFGVTKDGGRYEVRAKKAIVDFNRDAPIKLIDIDGDLVQVNNVTTNLKAKHGLLDNAKSELELFDGIDIKGSNGLQGAPVARHGLLQGAPHRLQASRRRADADRHRARRDHDHAHRHEGDDLRRRRARCTSSPRASRRARAKQRRP